MFSEKQTPVSELVKGDPEKPLREPAIALFAIVFNLFAIYQISEIIRQTLLWMVPGSDPWVLSYQSMMFMMMNTMIGVALFYSLMLLIGALVMRFLSRRAGAALILVFSIFTLFISFIAIAFGGFALIISAFLGLAAGVMGIRSKREIRERDAIEVI
ncbi:MAG: hypothetical protein ACFFCH_03435 [Promethearchaeota archaeon]